jgi:hypothetical protein
VLSALLLKVVLMAISRLAWALGRPQKTSGLDSLLSIRHIVAQLSESE